jgi:hypothetical protein
MSRKIKKVQYLEGYSLKLLFDDGKNKIVDLADIVRRGQNLIAQLKDIEFFRKVKCDGFSVIWPNGIDLCPDVLYKMGKDIPAERKKPSKRPVRKRSRNKHKAKSPR